MTMRTSARLFSVALLSLGLITGCASTDEAADSITAEQAIADAKAANAEAKAANFEWRDTGKLIEEAEAKLAAGDEEGAIALANQAKAQAETAVAQADAENKKFLNANAESAASSSSSSRGAMAGRVSSYSVVRGDNLWSISGKDEVYADPYQWPLIYKTNRDKIKDADLIYPGQVFDIDQNASASEIDAAVNHAKTRGAWSLGDTEQSDRDYLAK
jgi:nucleoid-associated protein YgaU